MKEFFVYLLTAADRLPGGAECSPTPSRAQNRAAAAGRRRGVRMKFVLAFLREMFVVAVIIAFLYAAALFAWGVLLVLA
jgi:hypothetical protein